ncbi:MAG: serine/threonine-protein kinase [Gemmatimonadales bacterium]|nr:serine/threonine-protein kinase [Gemmatimonadales bacterium]
MSALERLTAALADRYTIERELGQGGMATVYLAHDVKHDRKVAIKVLRPELAVVIGAERFLREIKTIATLQHPHILGLIDSGEVNGTAYYVMPFVEGESLRDRLQRDKQLPISDAVRLATEVAAALDYAHRHGVIHRDIKPENILLHDGSALVADFGIALAVSSAGGGSRMTETGMSLGTPHYMSPEQAMGEREITARSDVYALGAMTYEMLIGDPPFTGSTAQAIVAKVMTSEPAGLIAQRKSIPAAVEDAVLTALEKLPADRFASAKEFADALTGSTPTTRHGARGGLRTRSGRAGVSARLFTVVAALGAIAVVVAALGWFRSRPPLPVSRQHVALWRVPMEQFVSPGIARHATQAAIAPDGSSIVFTDSASGGAQLFRKLRNERQPVPIAGTEGGVSPFFSPDGAWIGYLTIDGKLKKVPTGGGGSITLAASDPIQSTATWLEDGTILFVDGAAAVSRVAATGGTSSVVFSYGAGQRQTVGLLTPLPESRGFLFTTCPGNCAITSSIWVFDFAADSARQLMANAAGAWYAPAGHLLYTDRNGGLFAAAFDLDRLALTSGAVPVVDGVVPTAVAVSASGSILYSVDVGGGGAATLAWVARDGSTEPLDSTWRGEFEYPAVSPDGNSVAVSVRDGATHLWLRRSDGTRQKLTQAGTVNWRASWTADGQAIAFASNMRGGGSSDDFDLYLLPVGGVASPQLLQHHTFGIWEAELSRDGEWLVLRADEEDGTGIIRARRLRGDTALMPIVVSKFNAAQTALSPDGRWLAYSTNSSGRQEIYVTPFPGAEVNRLVSRDGGTEPRWARNGRELFYKSEGRLMTVAVAPGPALTLGTPRPLFSVAGYRSARNRQQYDVALGGDRFLMITNRTADATGTIVYVENWFTELQAKMKQ